MLVLKAGDRSGVVRLTVAGAKLSVTLSTRRVRRGLQEKRSVVLDVAGCTCGSESLIGMVHGRIVAGETGLVSNLRGEGPSLCDVAERALLRKHGMSMGEWPARIHFLAALRALRDKPAEGDCRNRHGQPETPAPERVRVREILQVNALGEFLGCPRPSQHL
jgi:hypothetical protein